MKRLAATIMAMALVAVLPVSASTLAASPAAAATPAPGAIDSDYGNGGHALVDLDPGADEGRGVVAVPLTGGSQVIGQVGYLTVQYMVLFRLTASGAVDETWGTDGFVHMAENETVAEQWIAVDGSSLVLIQILGTDPGWFVERLDPSGQVDEAFGDAGRARLDDIDDRQIFRVAMTPAGDLLATSNATDGIVSSVLLDGETGELVTSYGTNGIATTAVDEAMVYVTDVAIDSQGRAVLWGPYGMVRLTTTGALDTSFGAGFVFATWQLPQAFALLPDDGVVILSANPPFTVDGSPGYGVLRAFDADGSARESFGMEGFAAVTDPAEYWITEYPTQVVVDAEGRILLTSTGNGLTAGYVRRLLPDGSYDASFGGDGTVRPGPGGAQPASVRQIALQPDGSILVTGLSRTTGNVSSWMTYVTRIGGGTGTQPTTGRYVPALSAVRLLDTRPSSQLGHTGPKPSAGSTTRVHLDRFPVGLPPNATAVVLNVIATGSAGAGFVTAHPTGITRPFASNLNLERAGQTIANLVVVAPGADDEVALYTSVGTHLVADLIGWYVPASSTETGRTVPLQPARILDTRPSGPRVGYGGAKPVGGQVVNLDVAGRGGVPASGAQAVVLNLTATEAAGPGFVTLYPHVFQAERPFASNLNTTAAGQTIANQVVVRLGEAGDIDLYTSVSTHLVVDVVGYITSPLRPDDDAGLFVSATPRRFLDTRPNGPRVGYSGPKPGDASTVRLAVTGRAPVPASGVTAVLINVTATEATAAGFVTVWPAGAPRPLASSLNVERPGHTIPNLVMSRVGPSTGAIDLYSHRSTHLVGDLAGWFTA